MIFKEYDINGIPYYQLYDAFFENWTQAKDFWKIKNDHKPICFSCGEKNNVWGVSAILIDGDRSAVKKTSPRFGEPSSFQLKSIRPKPRIKFKFYSTLILSLHDDSFQKNRRSHLWKPGYLYGNIGDQPKSKKPQLFRVVVSEIRFIIIIYRPELLHLRQFLGFH